MTAGSTAEIATGLGQLGNVRLPDPPHTGGNYLMAEMVYRNDRKNARKLGNVAIVFGFGVP